MGDMAFPEALPPSEGPWWEREQVSPNHFYAAYSFDEAASRQSDVVAVIEEARGHGCSVRYWWLSDAMDLEGAPDRLIVCVHHLSRDENAGLDLYEALKQQGTRWDDLESAAPEEYLMYSRTITEPHGLRYPDGRPLFPTPKSDLSPPPHPEPALRDDEPRFALTVGDIQEALHERMGRPLTTAELKAIIGELEETLDWRGALAVAQFTCQMDGRVGPSVHDDDVEPPPYPPEDIPFPDTPPLGDIENTRFLVSYLLSGMMLAMSTDAHAASTSTYKQLHELIEHVELDGVTPEEASRARLGDLAVRIEAVEAVAFPTDE